MKIGELDEMIKVVCPIDGIDSNGIIWFKEEATEGQRIAAQEIMSEQIENLEA